jgi:anti-anti-sigma factor
MHPAPHAADRRNQTSWRIAPRKGEQKNTGRCLRFDRTIGFWLGGAILGSAGCVIGFAFPCQYAAGVAASMLWWGIYAGVPGACVGALLGWLVERPAAASEPAPAVEPPVPVGRAVASTRFPDPAPRLVVSTGLTADGLVIRIRGVAGVNQSGELLSGLLAASARRLSVVILDLSDLQFISSLAMGILVTYRGSVFRAGGTVRLAERLQPEVHAALARAGLLELFAAPL